MSVRLLFEMYFIKNIHHAVKTRITFWMYTIQNLLFRFKLSYSQTLKLCTQLFISCGGLVNNFYDFCFNQKLSENGCNFLAINLMMKKKYSGLRFKATCLLKYVLILAVVVLLMVSCKVTQPSSYFKNLKKDTTLVGAVTSNFELKIMKGDRLSVSVTSLSTVEDAIFNSAGGSGGQAGGTAGSSGGYVVQQDGTILLHRLGMVEAAGITRKELSKKLEEKLVAYMKEPIVQVNFLNHKVTVMGEVGTPQVLRMPEEPLTIIDALILSGDVTANGKRNNIAIIREEGTDRKVKHVNLENNSIFSSPLYYLQPNDIVLVSADNEKFKKEENLRKYQTTLSLVLSGFSFLIIILDRVIK